MHKDSRGDLETLLAPSANEVITDNQTVNLDQLPAGDNTGRQLEAAINEVLDEAEVNDRYDQGHASNERLLARRNFSATLHELSATLFAPKDEVSTRELVVVLEQLINTPFVLAAGKTYTLEKVLGRGGFGYTFLAKDADGAECVIKISRPADRNNMFLSPEATAAVEAKQRPTSSVEARARAQAYAARSPIVETAVLHELTKLGRDNPGPALFDAEFIANPNNKDLRVGVIVMERVAGKTLGAYLEGEYHNDQEHLKIALQLADSLAILHERHIFHGDIKPENMMVNEGDSGPSLKLIDYGISMLAERQKKQIERADNRPPEDKRPPVSYARRSSNAATARYAPENEVVTRERDLYALGRTLNDISDYTSLTILSDLKKLSAELRAENPARRPDLHYVSTKIRAMLRKVELEAAKRQLNAA